jgi:hypothetical protein
MKIHGFAKKHRVGETTGALAVLAFLFCVPASAQINGVYSVCVDLSDGAMRMLLKAIPSPPCSAGEQFMQWGAQGPPGPEGRQGPQGPDGRPGPRGLAGFSGVTAAPALIADKGVANKGASGVTKLGPTVIVSPLFVVDDARNIIFTVMSADQGIAPRTGSATGPGGIVTIFDGKGGNAVTLGTGATGDPGLEIAHPSGGEILLKVNGNGLGTLQYTSGGKKVAELAPGNKDQMGLRIFNKSGAEVLSLEALPNGNGGLRIGNSRGGTAATIAPNDDGVGVFHGITIPLLP